MGYVGADAEKYANLFPHALRSLAHRGPDDADVVRAGDALLGHRRLAIIDLSAAGRQPMQDPETGAWIVYNGMLYNYRELREELKGRGHRFTSGTDTEVILKSVVEWGEAALSRFNGMWALAVWWPDQGTLFLSRDRFGVKPLYIARTGSGLAFASEAKALLQLKVASGAVDAVAVHDFLTFGIRNSGGQSFFTGLELFPAASVYVHKVASNVGYMNRFWSYPDQENSSIGTEADSYRQFEDVFQSAVRLRLRSDVPLGTSLSGGLDSTAILAGAVAAGHQAPTCFTSVFNESGSGEAPWARRAAAPYGISPVEVPAERDRWIQVLGSITWHMDGPSSSPAVFPLWCLMEEARRQGVRVLLEGQGADELFGGYVQYPALTVIQQLRLAFREYSVPQLRAAIAGAVQLRAGYGGVVLPLLKEAFPPLRTWNQRWLNAGSALRAEIRREGDHSRPRESTGGRQPDLEPVSILLWRDHSSRILPSLLDYGDSISMAHGVETRQPFLDYRLVEWGFRQPDEVKVRNGETKWLIRKFLRNVAQDAIANRSDKVGYVTPAHRWLLANRGELVEDFLLSSGSRVTEFCEPARIRMLLTLARAGLSVVNKSLYRLFALEIWLRELGKGRWRTAQAAPSLMGQNQG
jgi:asparagine synthase (glutamine-hydrolysing)